MQSTHEQGTQTASKEDDNEGEQRHFNGISDDNIVVSEVKDCLREHGNDEFKSMIEQLQLQSSDVASFGDSKSGNRVDEKNVFVNANGSGFLYSDEKFLNALNGCGLVPLHLNVPLIKGDMLLKSASTSVDALRSVITETLKKEGRLDESTKIPDLLCVEASEVKSDEVQDITVSMTRCMVVETEMLLTLFTCMSIYSWSNRRVCASKFFFKYVSTMLNYLFSAANKLVFRDKLNGMMLMGIAAIYEKKVNAVVLNDVHTLVQTNDDLKTLANSIQQLQKTQKNKNKKEREGAERDVQTKTREFLLLAMTATNNRDVFVYLGFMLVYVMIVTDMKMKTVDRQKYFERAFEKENNKTTTKALSDIDVGVAEAKSDEENDKYNVNLSTANIALEVRGAQMLLDITTLWKVIYDKKSKAVISLPLKSPKNCFAQNGWFAPLAVTVTTGEYCKRALLYSVPESAFVRWNNTLSLKIALYRARVMCENLAEDAFNNIATDPAHGVCAVVYGKWLVHVLPFLGCRYRTSMKVQTEDFGATISLVLFGEEKKDVAGKKQWQADLFMWFSYYYYIFLTSFPRMQDAVFRKGAAVVEDTKKKRKTIQKDAFEYVVVHSIHRILRPDVVQREFLDVLRQNDEEYSNFVDGMKTPRSSMIRLRKCLDAFLSSKGTLTEDAIEQILHKASALVEDTMDIAKINKKFIKISGQEESKTLSLTDCVEQTGFLVSLCKCLASSAAALNVIELYSLLVLCFTRYYTTENVDSNEIIQAKEDVQCSGIASLRRMPMLEVIGNNGKVHRIQDIRIDTRFQKQMAKGAVDMHTFMVTAVDHLAVLRVTNAVNVFLREHALEVETEMKKANTSYYAAFQAFFEHPAAVQDYQNARSSYAFLVQQKVLQPWRFLLYFEHQWAVCKFTKLRLKEVAFPFLHVEVRKSACLQKHFDVCAEYWSSLQQDSSINRVWTGADALFVAKMSELIQCTKRQRLNAADADAEWNALIGVSSSITVFDPANVLMRESDMNDLIQLVTGKKCMLEMGNALYSHLLARPSVLGRHVSPSLFGNADNKHPLTDAQKKNIVCLYEHLVKTDACTHGMKATRFERVQAFL